jgi:flagellin-like protein
MRKLLRNRKAVSPVVSAVIMILVVMIAMSALFAFFVSYAADFQLGSGSAVLESMTVEDVWFESSSNVEIWVYNTGKANLAITSVYVNDTLSLPVNLEIPVGKHGKLTVTPTIQLETEQTYTFKLVTKRGTSVEGTFKWS